MSSTTSAEQRAALLKELARDFNPTRTSFGSSQRSQRTNSPDTTTTSFDPKGEGCLESTDLNIYTPQKQVNTAQELPELRASAQRYNIFAPRQPPPEPDYAINTSALGRAFPDFTQAGPSDSDDGSRSVETGRAHSRASNGTIGKLGQSSTRPQNSAMSVVKDSFNPTPSMTINNNNQSPITKPHPINNPRLRKSLNPARQEQSQNSQPQTASGVPNPIKAVPPQMAKTRDNGSGSSRQSSYMARAVNGARIISEKDVSTISEERPPTVDSTVRSSRFGGTRKQKTSTGEVLPGRFSSKQEFVQTLPKGNLTNAQGQHTQETATPTYGTQQSFAVPTMPNVNELVSGIYEDGRPVFSRDGAARAARGSNLQQRQTSRPDLVVVDDIAVDDEEQDIYLALKLAQDKVADLERERAETEVFIQELENRNRVLEAEKARQRLQRSDSAIGMTDGASDGASDEMGSGRRKLLIEKDRLESSVRALQNQVASIDRHAAVSETALRNVTNERDSAVSQLGVAFFTIEQLKTDNANLSDENQALREQLATAQVAKEKQVRHATPKAEENSLLQERSLEKSLSAKLSMSNTKTNKPRRGQTPNAPQLSSFEQFKAKLAIRQAQREAHDSAAAQGSVAPTGQRDASDDRASRQSGHQKRIATDEPHPTDLFPRDQQVQRPSHYQPSQCSEDSDRDDVHKESVLFEAPPSSRQQSGVMPAPTNQDANQDLTFLSFVESDEVANLRQALEHERVEDKPAKAVKCRVSKVDDHTEQAQATETRLVLSDTSLRRKPSLKASTRKVTDPMDITGRSWVTADDTQQSKKSITEHNRRHSSPETSVPVQRKQQHTRQVDNMTSAFILPDITIRHPSSGPIRQVSAGAEAVLDDIKFHNGQNCTVCHQLISRDEDHHHHGETKRTIKVPKPVPVSRRMPEPDVYNEEPTIRPSQPPAHALATVIKCLEDELRHLKMKLSQYQDLYNSHDAAISRRQRKDCGKKIEGLLKDVDVKADQIYALYDALEGQKENDHEMTGQELDETLQSIGVDPAEISVRDEDADEVPRPKTRHPWDLESSDEEELPWEGIESTSTGRFANGVQGQPRSLSA